jgi:DNA-binding CsgD family transcriptional regulator/tetratricopeptide (TPR) repeat protein
LVSNRTKQLSQRLEIGHHQQMGVLEREAFLDSLVDYAGEAESGASRLVFLAGEAGVGKTTLLELLRQALPNARWVLGACDGSFTPQPLGPLFDIAPQLGGAIDVACAGDAPRDRLFRVLLEQLAPPSLFTVLVIEDAHWADEATTDLIRFLGRRMRESPTMLVVSYRDEGLAANHPLRLTLGDLTPERSFRRMTLPPLSPVAVNTLAAGSGVSGDDLYALTGGNPFFVNEVLGVNSPTLPVSARDAVLARVARLSPDARAVLDAVAVLGSDVDPALAGVVGERSAGLDECLDSGVLVSESAGVRFRHELARLAVEGAIPGHRQREFHTRALAALRDRPGTDLARLAHHAEGALDAPAVLEYAVVAAERAEAMSAHREAAAQFSRALRFATDRPIEQRAELHDRLATELQLIEDWRRSDEERSRAVDLWRKADNRLRLGDSLRRLSRARLRMFDKTGLGLMTESIAVLEALPDSVALAWAYSNKAGALMYDDPPQAIEAAQRARKVLETTGADDPGLVSDSLNSEACALENLGETSVHMLEEALRVALQGNAHEQAARAYNNLVCVLVTSNQIFPALRYAEEGLPYCQDHELDMFMHCLIGAHIGVLDKLGRWDEAIEIAEHELAKPTLSPFNRSAPLMSAGSIYARRGNRKAAEPLLAESTAVMNDMGCNEDNMRRVEFAWLDGDMTEARRRAVTLAMTPGVAAELTTELAVWLKRLGENPDDYELLVDPVRERQIREPWPAVAAMWAELGSPYEQALALYDSGDEAAMRDAITILDRLGASAAINVVRGEMRRLGYTSIPRGVRSATREDDLGLTRRQREVLALLAEGLTNAEIGKRLFLSERTVDNHVTAVLAKLGVDSRREAVRHAALHGRAHAGG